MIERVEQWLRWPLWSWRNLVVTTVAVLVLFTVVGRLTANTTAAAESAAPRPVETVPVTVPNRLGTSVPPSLTSSSLPSSTATSVGTASTGQSATGGGSASADPTTAAVAFVTEWTRATSDQSSWLAALKPLTTAEYQSSLATVDPSRVPARRVLDTGKLLSASGQRSLVQVATDGGAMTVTLVLRDGSWLVSDIEPANQPPGAPTPALTARPSATR